MAIFWDVTSCSMV